MWLWNDEDWVKETDPVLMMTVAAKGDVTSHDLISAAGSCAQLVVGLAVDDSRVSRALEATGYWWSDTAKWDATAVRRAREYSNTAAEYAWARERASGKAANNAHKEAQYARERAQTATFAKRRARLRAAKAETRRLALSYTALIAEAAAWATSAVEDVANGADECVLATARMTDGGPATVPRGRCARAIRHVLDAATSYGRTREFASALALASLRQTILETAGVAVFDYNESVIRELTSSLPNADAYRSNTAAQCVAIIRGRISWAMVKGLDRTKQDARPVGTQETTYPASRGSFSSRGADGTWLHLDGQPCLPDVPSGVPAQDPADEETGT